jgi:hypothetical protein
VINGDGTALETMSSEPIDTGMIIFLDASKHTTLRKADQSARLRLHRSG